MTEIERRFDNPAPAQTGEPVVPFPDLPPFFWLRSRVYLLMRYGQRTSQEALREAVEQWIKGERT